MGNFHRNDFREAHLRQILSVENNFSYDLLNFFKALMEYLNSQLKLYYALMSLNFILETFKQLLAQLQHVII